MFKYHAFFLQILLGMMLFQMLCFGIYLKRRKISASGIPPLHPVLFIIAKVAMGLCWLSLFIQAAGFYDLSVINGNDLPTVAAVVLFAIGILLQFLSYATLGKNLKFGLPTENEATKLTLKVTGIYRISRNPMYVGFFLMTIAACLYVLHPLIWTLSLFSIVVHHMVVLKEETFLNEAFGKNWDEYSKKVRRYL